MIFKNLTALSFLAKGWNEVEGLAHNFSWQPCPEFGVQSIGWIKHKDEQYVQNVDNYSFMRFRIEKKQVPGSVVKKEVIAAAQAAANEQGFPPGRRQLKEIKADVIDMLLAKAFTVENDINVIIDRKRNRAYIDSASASVVEIIAAHLRRTFYEVEVSFFLPTMKVKLTEWVGSATLPEVFTLDDEVDLTDSESLVRFQRMDLDCEEVDSYLAAGFGVVRLALTWDDKLSFVIKADGSINRLSEIGAKSMEADAGAVFSTGELLGHLTTTLAQ